MHKEFIVSEISVGITSQLLSSTAISSPPSTSSERFLIKRLRVRCALRLRETDAPRSQLYNTWTALTIKQQPES